MKKLLGILILSLLWCNIGLAEDKEDVKLPLDMLIFEIDQLSGSGITFNYDELAKKHGFKSFEEAVKKYKKKFKVKLNVKQAKFFFEKVDVNLKINYSQKNLDRLHYLIFNDKTFAKWQKKKNSYLKSFKKGKYKKWKIDTMMLAVYINFEKEMARLTKDPNLEAISPFAWDWRFSTKNDTIYAINVIYDCEKDARKYKLIGGKCIIVDFRKKDTGEIKNMLKPKFTTAEEGEDKVEAKAEAKVEAKATEEPTESGNIIKELNDLNELYKSGTLTKEEFTKAKKKLLNIK